MERWYVLYTKPNAEYQVVAALQQQELETYLPEIDTTGSSSRQRRSPFFPCYLFLKVDFEKVGFSQVQWTPGLRRILAFEEQLLPVRDEVVDLIRRRLEAIESTGQWPGHDFEPGETVRITDGPFQDMLAIFEGPTTPSQRVQVLLKFLGASRVQVDVSDLEKASPETKPSTSKKRPRRTRGRGRRIKRAA